MFCILGTSFGSAEVGAHSVSISLPPSVSMEKLQQKHVYTQTFSLTCISAKEARSSPQDPLKLLSNVSLIFSETFHFIVNKSAPLPLRLMPEAGGLPTCPGVILRTWPQEHRAEAGPQNGEQGAGGQGPPPDRAVSCGPGQISEPPLHSVNRGLDGRYPFLDSKIY